MATTLPIEIFRLLEDKIGRDEAVKVSGAIALSLQSIENKANDTALQKKLELKDELTKELASKADVLQAKTELRAEIKEVRSEMKLYFVILLSAIFITNPKAIEVIAKLFGLVK
jgi:hypothetical protein